LRRVVTGFDFTGDCQYTRVELCACTSDRERSTRAGEACTSDRQHVNANPDSDSYSCLVNVALLGDVVNRNEAALEPGPIGSGQLGNSDLG